MKSIINSSSTGKSDSSVEILEQGLSRGYIVQGRGRTTELYASADLLMPALLLSYFYKYHNFK